MMEQIIQNQHTLTSLDGCGGVIGEYCGAIGDFLHSSALHPVTLINGGEGGECTGEQVGEIDCEQASEMEGERGCTFFLVHNNYTLSNKAIPMAYILLQGLSPQD